MRTNPTIRIIATIVMAAFIFTLIPVSPVLALRPIAVGENVVAGAVGNELTAVAKGVGKLSFKRQIAAAHEFLKENKLPEDRLEVDSGKRTLVLNLSYATLVFDISALANLTSLQKLDLTETNVSDISALEKLTNLQELHLSRTPVSGIRVLEKLTNLQVLYLSGTQVSDISVLEKLTNLQELHLSHTSVSDIDISVLGNLINLQKLYITGTRVSDIRALASIINLQELGLSGTKVSDIRALANFKKLRKLYLFNTPVSDISALLNLTNLQELYLYATHVSNEDVFSIFSQDENGSLFITLKDGSKAMCTNRVVVAKGAGELSFEEQIAAAHEFLRENGLSEDRLKVDRTSETLKLYLSGTKVSDISALANLTNLQVLDLTGTLVSDISVLENLTNLQKLYLSNTRVFDISSLEKLTNLQELYLSATLVSDISALASLTNLQVLNLSGIKIFDISALANLKNLWVLNLFGTLVSNGRVFSIFPKNEDGSLSVILSDGSKVTCANSRDIIIAKKTVLVVDGLSGKRININIVKYLINVLGFVSENITFQSGKLTEEEKQKAQDKYDYVVIRTIKGAFILFGRDLPVGSQDKVIEKIGRVGQVIERSL